MRRDTGFTPPADPDDLELSIPHADDGRSLRYHADEFAITWIAALARRVARAPDFAEASRLFDAEMLTMYVEDILYRQLMPLCRAYMRRAYLSRLGHEIVKPVSCPTELFELISAEWPDPSIPLVAQWDPIPVLRRMDRTRLHIKEALRRLAAPTPLPKVAHPVVAVEVVEGTDPSRKADAFWLAANVVDPARVLFVFERHNKVFLDLAKELAQIEKMGAHCIALHASVSADGRIPVWVPPPAPQWLKSYRKSLPARGSLLQRWIRRTLSDFAGAVWRWESFFRHFNVAVYQQFTESWVDAAPRRLALEQVGGVQVGKMRSQFFAQSSAGFYFQHEVGFVWHDNVRDILVHGRTRTHHVVAVGYPWDHLFDSMAEEGARLRERLLKPGVSMVVCVYDNHPHINGVSSLHHVRQFYAYLVELANRRPGLALLVKSKKPQILREMMPEIHAALRALESEGRCIVLDEPLASVVPAALAADLVVAIPAATAACEAALGGRDVLMYDPSGSQDHPWSGEEKGLIYASFDRFASALEATIDELPGRGETNSAPYLRLIDPFCDRGAARRAGAYIAGFLDAHERGLDKRSALGAAQRAYDEACKGPADAHARQAVEPQIFTSAVR